MNWILLFLVGFGVAAMLLKMQKEGKIDLNKIKFNFSGIKAEKAVCPHKKKIFKTYCADCKGYLGDREGF